MITAEQLAKVRLFRSENVGAVTFRSLIAHFKTAQNALDNLPDCARRGGRLRPLKICSKDEAGREIERLEKAGARLVFSDTPEYSRLLAALPDAPPFLSVWGNPALLNGKNIAVVGTRNASVNGKNIARRMSADFVAAGYNVVSGLAIGIDVAAHEGALYAATDKASTIAVLGTGLNIPYPAQNRRFYDEIREKGLLVSEFPIDTKPQPSNFPYRNRIISGLSAALVVIEAALRSGSLITANKALEQGREVFAVPASPTDERAAGVNHLIKTGAPLVESAQDVIAALTENPILGLSETEHSVPAPIKNKSESGVDATALSCADFLEKMDGTPIGIDELVRETGLPAAAISVLLVELELAGRIERLPGGKVIRIMNPVG